MKITKFDKILMSETKHYLINVTVKQSNKKYDLEATYTIQYPEMLPFPIYDFAITAGIPEGLVLTEADLKRIKQLAKTGREEVDI